MGVTLRYQHSEIGLIPDDWTVSPLDTLASVVSGKRLPLGTSLTDDITPHPYIRVSDMRPGTVSLNEIKYVPRDVFPAISRYRIFKEDIFISVAGTLGIVGKIPAELDGANLTENADRITGVTCSRDYLLYVLMSPTIQRIIQSLQTVGAQPKLALTRIRKFAILHPSSIAEQDQIARVLSDADALLKSLEQLIAKKRLIKHGAMQQLLTGQRRLPGFVGEWPTVRLGAVAEMSSGGTPPASNSTFYDGSVPWVSIADMTGCGKFISHTERCLSQSGLSNSAARMYPAGSVLYAMYASIGECSIAAIPVCSSQAILGIIPSAALDSEYLYYFLASIKRRARSLGQQGAQSNLNKGIVQNIHLPLPRLAEQTAIAGVLADMDAEIDALEQRLAKTRAVKAGMMQALLTGRIRLISSQGAPAAA